jgi:tetratricopeptide (TPR) repeat protein
MPGPSQSQEVPNPAKGPERAVPSEVRPVTLDAPIDSPAGPPGAANTDPSLGQTLSPARPERPGVAGGLPAGSPSEHEVTQNLPSGMVPAAASAAPAAQPTLNPEQSGRPAGWTRVLPPDQTAALSESATFLTIPGYEILGELGRGGMGVVYKARQLGLGRIVALKTILAGPHASGAGLARFRAEAEAVGRLQHPNVVQIHEVGTHEGRPFFSLEYCPGGSLAEKLDGTPWAPARAAHLVETLAWAVEAAHCAAVVHRDLKPANVLLAEDSTPKITDFGLAKKVGEEGQTASGAILGTPSYMAPEQAGSKGKEIGPPADIYALGAILYELLTGRPPFRAATPIDTVLQVVNAEPIAPSRLQLGVPRDLETVCLKCLEKEPHKRYPSAHELAEDLARFQHNEPIRARPVGTVERLLKWTRRRPAVAALVGVSALALLCVALGGLFYAQYQHDRAQLALRELNDRRRQDDARSSIHSLVDQARADMANQAWDQAKQNLSGARGLVAADPALEELREEVDRLLKEVDSQLDRQGSRQRALARLRRFADRRDQALLHGTLSIGEDLSASLRATEEQARAALAEFGLTPEDDSLPAPDPALTPTQREDLRDDCYLLVLVLAEAVAQPRPGQGPDAQRQAAEAALHLLERAERFGIDTRAIHRRRARYLRRCGRAEADAEARRAEQVQPARAIDYYLLGDDRYKEGELVEAARDFDGVLALRPQNFLARYFLAVCYVRLNRAVEAKAVLTACISQRSDFVWLYLMQGVANAQLEDFTAAESDFARAEKLLGEQPDEEARYALHANRGVVHARQKKVAQAIDDLHQAIALRPRQYQAYLTLAQIYQTEKKWDEALRYFNEAVEREPGYAFLYRNRARLRLERGEPDAALQDFEQAIRKARADPGADPHDLARDHVGRGKILLLRKEYPGALGAFDLALKAWPECADAHLQRARALLELPAADRKKRRALDEDAIKSLEAYRQSGGKPRFDVYRARGLAQTRLENYSEAIQAYSLALEQQPKDSATHAARGWLHLATHAADLALQDFQRALVYDAHNAEAYTGRGQARVAKGEYEAAVADAERAVRESKQGSNLLYDAARTYALVLVQLDDATPLPLARRAQVEAARRRRADYVLRAVDLLRQAIDGLPRDQRATFWRERVLRDPAFKPLRRNADFERMRTEHSGLAGSTGDPP